MGSSTCEGNSRAGAKSRREVQLRSKKISAMRQNGHRVTIVLIG
jgi:hypothetical protein